METVLDPGADGHEFYAGHGREAVVVGVERLEADYLVSIVADRHHGEDHGLGASCGDHHLGRLDGDAGARVVAADGLPQLGYAHARPVGQHLGYPALHRIPVVRRGGDVRLADVEVKDLDPSLFGGIREGVELADRGRLDLLCPSAYGGGRQGDLLSECQVGAAVVYSKLSPGLKAIRSRKERQ